MRAEGRRRKTASMTSTSRLVSAGLHTKGASVTRYTSSKSVFHQSDSTRIMHVYLHHRLALGCPIAYSSKNYAMYCVGLLRRANYPAILAGQLAVRSTAAPIRLCPVSLSGGH